VIDPMVILVLEIILSFIVLAAVIMLGALTWIGNERQNKSLEELRMDVRQWALGDLEIKREKAAREINIMDPISWLDDMVRRAMGTSPHIRDIASVLQKPDAIVTISENGRYLVFSPVRPDQMRKIIHKLDRSRKIRDTSPLRPMKQLGKRRSKVGAYELSALNAGIFFDVEADKVWKMVVKRSLDTNRLWIYDIPGPWETS